LVEVSRVSTADPINLVMKRSLLQSSTKKHHDQVSRLPQLGLSSSNNYSPKARSKGVLAPLAHPLSCKKQGR
ncbi:hypothetical protein AMTR_s00514p00011230, partial [Amborella trichopoda]